MSQVIKPTIGRRVWFRPTAATQAQPAGLDLNDDTPLAPVCDLSGDKPCEACQ